MNEVIDTSSLYDMMKTILLKLDRIEEKIDEQYYPPEECIKAEYIQSVLKAKKEIKTGNRDEYDSVQVLFQDIERDV